MNKPLDMRVSFTRLADATKADFDIMYRHMAVEHTHLADNVLKHLNMSGHLQPGLQVTRMEHALQTATRAFKDGATEELVVCALLHDIGDELAPDNHGAFASEILRPFLSEDNYNVVRYHPEFQGYFFFDKIGADKNMRESHRGKAWFDTCHHFCERWDMPAFDPAYESMPLSAFEPMVRRLFDKPPVHNGVALPTK
jgi:predicted HD phosphohydrolase